VWPFVVIVAGFIVFLLKNGGIVVGKHLVEKLWLLR
jgi:hypothetical protein